MTPIRRRACIGGAATFALAFPRRRAPRAIHARPVGQCATFVPENHFIKGLCLTPPTYWASVSRESPPHYEHPPYAGDWDSDQGGFPAARRAAALAAGFNTVRTFVDAGPFMDALSPGALNTPGELVLILVQNIARFVGAGFKVIVNYAAEVAPPNPAFAREAVLDGPDGVGFRKYCGGLADVCRGLASAFTPQQVAIELFNEPPHEWEWGSRAPWSVQAAAMWMRAREVAQAHTLIVQSRSGGFFGALPELQPQQFDANTLFSFHPYDPGGFTHQGIGENEGLYRITFPASDHPGGIVRAIADTRERVDAIERLDAREKEALFRHHVAALRDMFYPPNPMGPARMDRAWRVIDAWVERERIAPAQVLASEFGVTSDFNRNGALGCALASRARFYRAVRENVERRGFAGWAAWQSVGDFNLFEQTGIDHPGGTLIPEIVDALGLRA